MSGMKKFIGAAGLALLLSAGAAAAATLSVVNGTNFNLKSFNPSTVISGLSNGVTVQMFDGNPLAGGLKLAGQAEVKITFLGKEASSKDYAIETDSGLNGTLTNVAGTEGSFIKFTQLTLNDYVRFMFSTVLFGPPNPTITNGGANTNTRLAMAFSTVFNGGKSVYALFDDGASVNANHPGPDRDFDDMIVRIDVQAVPLPAGGLLLLTGLGGLLAARRRKSV